MKIFFENFAHNSLHSEFKFSWFSLVIIRITDSVIFHCFSWFFQLKNLFFSVFVDRPVPIHVPKPFPVRVDKPVPYKVIKKVPYAVPVPGNYL